VGASRAGVLGRADRALLLALSRGVRARVLGEGSAQFRWVAGDEGVRAGTGVQATGYEPAFAPARFEPELVSGKLLAQCRQGQVIGCHG
jgi:hypothetical protein